MAADKILASLLSGDADFAGSVFGKGPAPKEEFEAPVKTMDDPNPDIDFVNGESMGEERNPIETAEKHDPRSKDSQPEKKAVAEKAPEPKKSPRATTKDADKAVEKATEKATKVSKKEKTEDVSEDVVGDQESDDLPVNPHFQDKKVAAEPEGETTEKGITSWKEMKSEMKKAREERDRLKAELEAAKDYASKFEESSGKTYKEEIDNYKTKIAELSRELKVANFERSPEYIEQVRKPISAMQSDVREIAEANDTDFGKLWNAISEPDVRKRSDMLEDLTGDFKRMEQLAIIRMSEKFQDLHAFHSRMEKEAELVNDELQAKKAQEEQEFIEKDSRLQKVFLSKNWTSMEDKYDFLREVDGQEQWNSYIRNAKKGAAETNLDRLSVEDRSTILAKAAVVPFLESALSHYTAQLEKVEAEKGERIRELESQIQSFTGATPSLGKASDETTGADENEDDSSLTNFGASIFRNR